MEGTSPERQLTPERLTFKISAKIEAHPEHPGISEDAIAFNERAGYAMVLDGVGSSDGLRGSGDAKSRISRNLGKKETDISKAQERIRKLIRDTSVIISDRYKGTAQTTLVLAKLIDSSEGQKALIASVGDSRAYLLRNGEFKQITEDDDHPEIPEETAEKLSNVLTGEGLSDDELQHFRLRNIITQSIGSYTAPRPHFYQIDLRAGDKLVLTSDGIHDNLTNIEIGRIVQRGGRADRLVEAAKRRSLQGSFRSKRDDMSALVVEVSK